MLEGAVGMLWRQTLRFVRASKEVCAGTERKDRVSRSERRGGARLDEASPAFVLMSRILLGAIALLLVIIPWTERYSTLDNFPHGHDTELSLLGFFVLLGLLLLFVRSARKQIRSLLALRYALLSMLPAGPTTADRQHGAGLTDTHHPPLAASTLDLYTPPLQI